MYKRGENNLNIRLSIEEINPLIAWKIIHNEKEIIAPVKTTTGETYKSMYNSSKGVVTHL